jgi:hypothetical protein
MEEEDINLVLQLKHVVSVLPMRNNPKAFSILVAAHPPLPVASSVPESINSDDKLTAEQKQSLLSVYRSFVGSNEAATPTEGNDSPSR